MAAKLISKTKVITSPVYRMASSQDGSEVDLQKQTKMKKDHCLSNSRDGLSTSQALVHMTVHIVQCLSTLFGMQTHFQNTKRSVAYPPDLRAVAY